MSTISLIFRVVFSLGLTIGIILLVAKVYQKKLGLPSRVRPNRQVGQLVIRNRVALSKSSSVAVIDAGDRAFVIGITSQNISLLCDLGELGDIEKIDPKNDRHNALDTTPRKLDKTPSTIDLTHRARDLSNNSTIEELASKIRNSGNNASALRERSENILGSKLIQALSGKGIR